jgi:hypothetical protein
MVAKSKDHPHIVVLMIPTAGNGNLESMCLPAAYFKWELEPQLNDFVDKTPAKEWNLGKQAKMRVQAILAATNRSQPDAGFAAHWSQPVEYRIPLDHGCFDELVNFLKGFGQMIES